MNIPMIMVISDYRQHRDCFTNPTLIEKGHECNVTYNRQMAKAEAMGPSRTLRERRQQFCRWVIISELQHYKVALHES